MSKLNNIKKFTKYYIKMKALEEILKDMHPLILRELKRQPDGKAIASGVEYHITKKVERKYSDKIDAALKDLREKINQIKQNAEANGDVSLIEKETFDVYIPKSSKEQVFATIPDYKKYFIIGD